MGHPALEPLSYCSFFLDLLQKLLNRETVSLCRTLPAYCPIALRAISTHIRGTLMSIQPCMPMTVRTLEGIKLARYPKQGPVASNLAEPVSLEHLRSFVNVHGRRDSRSKRWRISPQAEPSRRGRPRYILVSRRTCPTEGVALIQANGP